MSNLNTGRLIIAGLAAGLVVNVVESVMNLFVLAPHMEGMLAALNLDPVGGAAIGGYVVLGFLLGFVVVWTYAAIRPRFGPGPGTAIKAGLAVWFTFYVMAGASNWLMGIVSVHLYGVLLIYSLIMMLAAAYVGGMVYRED